jgi:hypothetical protein
VLCRIFRNSFDTARSLLFTAFLPANQQNKGDFGIQLPDWLWFQRENVGRTTWLMTVTAAAGSLDSSMSVWKMAIVKVDA